MTRKLKKGIALFLTILMVVTMWTVPVYAEGTIEVIFEGVNVTVKSGTVGDNAASYGEDYVLTVEVSEGYTVYDTDVYGYGDSEYSNFNYTFDLETGVLTIPKEEIDGYGEELKEIHIDIYAMREYNADTELKKIDSLPYTDEFVILKENNVGIGMDDGVLTGCMKLYEVDLTEGQELMYTAVGTDTIGTDLVVYVAKKTAQANMFIELDYVDDDNKGFGEMGSFTAPETGTYVFIVKPFDNQYDEGVMFKLQDYPEMDDGLDFLQETVPTPDDDDLWAWDVDTKTLTLKDGFVLETEDCTIMVPDNSTINVEGKATVYSLLGDAICSNGNITINLKKGAELTVDAGYCGIFSGSGKISVIGEADEDGNLPVINSEADSGNILIEDDDHYDVIYDNVNEVVMKNVKATFKSKSECIYVYENTSEDEKGDVIIENCIIDFNAYDETIQTYSGDIIIKDSDSKLSSDDEEGLDGDDNVVITGGRIQISAVENAIDVGGKITITDSEFMLQFLNKDGLYDILWADDLSVGGGFIVYDLDMNILHEGEMTDEIKKMFEDNQTFDFRSEDGTLIYPKVVVSKYNGGSEDNVVEGVESDYEVTDTLEFTTDSEGKDLEDPVWGYTRFMARTWEIVDTDLSGVVDDDKTSIDISSLEEGTYTLKVRFEKQICQRDYWSFYTNASDDKIDYVEIQFKVLGVSEEVTPPPAEDDNKEEVPPAEDNKEENDKTPDTGAENYGFITVIVALLGVMVVAVKKNKKSAK